MVAQRRLFLLIASFWLSVLPSTAHALSIYECISLGIDRILCEAYARDIVCMDNRCFLRPGPGQDPGPGSEFCDAYPDLCDRRIGPKPEPPDLPPDDPPIDPPPPPCDGGLARLPNGECGCPQVEGLRALSNNPPDRCTATPPPSPPPASTPTPSASPPQRDGPAFAPWFMSSDFDTCFSGGLAAASGLVGLRSAEAFGLGLAGTTAVAIAGFTPVNRAGVPLAVRAGTYAGSFVGRATGFTTRAALIGARVGTSLSVSMTEGAAYVAAFGVGYAGGNAIYCNWYAR